MLMHSVTKHEHFIGVVIDLKDTYQKILVTFNEQVYSSD